MAVDDFEVLDSAESDFDSDEVLLLDQVKGRTLNLKDPVEVSSADRNFGCFKFSSPTINITNIMGSLVNMILRLSYYLVWHKC